MNAVLSEGDAPKRRRLSIIFTVSFSIGLFGVIAAYAFTH